MCGRFGLTRPERLDLERFGIQELPPLVPRFNIAPGAEILAIRERDGVRRGDLLRWGLVPAWAKDPEIGNRMANARADTAFEKPTFRNAMKSRRCLIPADVFYEWQAVPGASRKRPHAILRPDREPFAMGGLWEYWKAKDAPGDGDGDGEAIVSCAILTTDANTLMTPIHHRPELTRVLKSQECKASWSSSTESRTASKKWRRAATSPKLSACHSA